MQRLSAATTPTGVLQHPREPHTTGIVDLSLGNSAMNSPSAPSFTTG
jgi:hypothetical protein